ncbi:hypothetical protein D1872_212900 [compost metagenome]
MQHLKDRVHPAFKRRQRLRRQVRIKAIAEQPPDLHPLIMGPADISRVRLAADVPAAVDQRKPGRAHHVHPGQFTDGGRLRSNLVNGLPGHVDLLGLPFFLRRRQDRFKFGNGTILSGHRVLLFYIPRISVIKLDIIPFIPGIQKP